MTEYNLYCDESCHLENGVNIPAVCRSIMNEVRYVVNKNTGAEVRAVDVFVDSMIL